MTLSVLSVVFEVESLKKKKVIKKKFLLLQLDTIQLLISCAIFYLYSHFSTLEDN